MLGLCAIVVNLEQGFDRSCALNAISGEDGLRFNVNDMGSLLDRVPEMGGFGFSAEIGDFPVEVCI
jgi:hypothetical protein